MSSSITFSTSHIRTPSFVTGVGLGKYVLIGFTDADIHIVDVNVNVNMSVSVRVSVSVIQM